MSSCIRVLSTQTVDSTPSLLVVSPDGTKMLVNCGEGTQRQFLEYSQKISSVDTVCLTHIGHDALGGLPGLILTAADSTLLSSIQQKEKQQQKQQQLHQKRKQQQQGSSNNSNVVDVPGLEIVGPTGTNDFLKSLRHFMRRDAFKIQVHEGNYNYNNNHGERNEKQQEQQHQQEPEKEKAKKQRQNKRTGGNPNGKLRVESIAVTIAKKRPRDEETQDNDDVDDGCSQRKEIFTTINQDLEPQVSSSSSPSATATVTGPVPQPTPPISPPATTAATTTKSHNGRPHREHQHLHRCHHRRREVLSFLFTTPPIQGKFLAEKAKELGIPKGPLYGQLKAGKSVVFLRRQLDGDDEEEVIVEPHQVVEPGHPGVAVAILCYPTIEVLQLLRESERIQEEINHDQFRQTSESSSTGSRSTSPTSLPTTYPEPTTSADKPTLQLVVHMTTTEIFESKMGIEFRSLFTQKVDHMFVPTDEPANTADSSKGVNENNASLTNSNTTMTPFHAAAVGAHLRSMVAPTVYTTPFYCSSTDNENDNENTAGKERSNHKQSTGTVQAIPLLEYALLPLSKQGFQNYDAFDRQWKMMKQDGEDTLKASGALEFIQRNSSQTNANSIVSMDINTEAEILFTGTGSAIPCKHRNVSGIYVKMENGNSILLDIGEGTIGQLLRAKQNEDYSVTLSKIKAVWISHPHADHHLGILRLLAERKMVTDDKLIIIAPSNLRFFLQEYEELEPSIKGSYSFLDCREISTKSNPASRQHFVPALLNRLRDELGIQSCSAIPVAHCPNSFAVVFHGTSFGSLAYSGDCRPSRPFAHAAHGADILIHEATFADGMEAEATVKRHCTVGEAIDVARQMHASTLLLTHFSQRYPNIPPLPTLETTDDKGTKKQMKIIPCFDYMRVTPSNLTHAAQVIPALQLLYPDHVDGDEDHTAEVQSALEIPGLFAHPEIL